MICKGLKENGDRYKAFQTREYNKMMTTIHNVMIMMISLKLSEKVMYDFGDNVFSLLKLKEHEKNEFSVLVMNIAKSIINLYSF